MTTNRSLNKLEFKAHMSIHNTKEVVDGESHGSNGTRDRFGKNHLLSDQDGTSRLPRRQAGIARRKRKLKLAAACALLGPLFCVPVLAADLEPDAESANTHRRNTDIHVETEGLDENSWLNQKINQPEEKYGLAVDKNTSLGFNEDGDPALATSF